MLEFAKWFLEVFLWAFLVYSLIIVLIYGWIGIYAFGAVRKYNKENLFTDYDLIINNPNAPTFSLIAPAYNEGVTIVENVRSLLSLYYHKLEIIIVNDGSKDDSIEKLIAAYDLEKISLFIQGNIPTKEIKGVYKSKNPAFKKLIVVDKENGGKADALNVGINISKGDTIVCIDVDCILEQNAIVKLAKPFLEETNEKVIACGGVIRLANNCIIENGKVTQVNLPKTWLGRAQALEYIRAFVLGRMAWSRASNLILISGAFGAFDKKIVVACGGYDTKTVGEDMELVIRMRRYMVENKRPHKVVNIPDSLCWTEAPESKEILKKQRNRWMRGTMETLWKHRKVMFNPSYGRLGLVSLPYWLLFEFMAPLIEYFGYFLFICFVILGIINLPFFFTITALVVGVCVLFSIFAVFVDLITCRVYTKQRDFLIIIRTALIEPFYYHTFVTKASVSGFFDYFRKKSSWGNMTRQGFQQDTQGLTFKEKLVVYFKESTQYWSRISLTFLVLFLISTIVEWQWYVFKFPEIDLNKLILPLFLNNTVFSLLFIASIGLIFLITQLIWPKTSKKTLVAIYILTLLFHYFLFVYFGESKNLMGADIFYFNINEILFIVETSGVLSFKNILILLVIFCFLFFPLYFTTKLKSKNWKLSIALLVTILLIVPSFLFLENGAQGANSNEFLNNIAQSKWSYFFKESKNEIIEDKFNFNSWEDQLVSNKSVEYPFLKLENTKDILGSYFNKSNETPNLVLIVVEGLGHAYSSPNGYVGNFTPFIDSLSQKSLFWPNCLSSTGRTFGALPTLTGSLPFGKNGFLQINETPEHYNLFNVLKANGFETGFFYGGDVSFDGMKKYLTYSGVDQIVEESSFDSTYKKLPKGEGDSWGFEDQAVFSKMLTDQKISNQPYFNMALTLSTHSPFLINNSKQYENKYSKILAGKILNDEQKKFAKESKKELITVLNLDDALQNFFNAYQKRSDFKNTIFVITGDHSMPEISLVNKIDRFHVPLIIYSPLLKESKQFHYLVSHFDLAPTLLAFYRSNYEIKTPNQVTWVGSHLKTEKDKSSSYPIMKSIDKLDDFIFEKYHLSENKILVLDRKLNEEFINDDTKLTEKINQEFKKFKSDNSKFIKSKKLMPDSLNITTFKTKHF